MAEPRCPNCANPIPPKAAFCPHCGQYLSPLMEPARFVVYRTLQRRLSLASGICVLLVLLLILAFTFLPSQIWVFDLTTENWLRLFEISAPLLLLLSCLGIWFSRTRCPACHHWIEHLLPLIRDRQPENYCRHCGTRLRQHGEAVASCVLLAAHGRQNCFVCGGDIEASDGYCPECGANQGMANVLAPAFAKRFVDSTQQSAYCHGCGTRWSSRWLWWIPIRQHPGAYCSVCGVETTLQPPAELCTPTRCPRCKSEAKQRGVFCERCGGQLEAGKASVWQRRARCRYHFAWAALNIGFMALVWGGFALLIILQGRPSFFGLPDAVPIIFASAVAGAGILNLGVFLLLYRCPHCQAYGEVYRSRSTPHCRSCGIRLRAYDNGLPVATGERAPYTGCCIRCDVPIEKNARYCGACGAAQGVYETM